MKEKSKIPMPLPPLAKLEARLTSSQNKDQASTLSRGGQSGAAMVEYALLIALILTVCISSVMTIGQDARDMYTDVGAAFGDQIQPN